LILIEKAATNLTLLNRLKHTFKRKALKNFEGFSFNFNEK